MRIVFKCNIVTKTKLANSQYERKRNVHVPNYDHQRYFSICFPFFCKKYPLMITRYFVFYYGTQKDLKPYSRNLSRPIFERMSNTSPKRLNGSLELTNLKGRQTFDI